MEDHNYCYSLHSTDIGNIGVEVENDDTMKYNLEKPKMLKKRYKKSIPSQPSKSLVKRRCKKYFWKCNCCNQGHDEKNPPTKHGIDTEEKPYECRICGEHFEFIHQLESHQKDHEANDRSWTCPECGKLFAGYWYGRIHSQYCRIMGYKDVKLPNICDICSKSFTKKYDLDMHLRSHSNERPYQCTLCEKSFKQAKTLNEHEFWHEKKRFTCNLCKKCVCLCKTKMKDVGVQVNLEPALTGLNTSTLETNLSHLPGVSGGQDEIKDSQKSLDATSNLNVVENEPVVRILTAKIRDKLDSNNTAKKIRLESQLENQNESNVFKCDHCDETFDTKNGLEEHICIRINDCTDDHVEEGPHKCEICGTAFEQFHELESHTTIHIIERPWSCSVCNAAFVTYRNCKKHTMTCFKPIKTDQKPKMPLVSNVAPQWLIIAGDPLSTNQQIFLLT